MDFKKANFSLDDIFAILQLYPLKTENVKILDSIGIANDNYRVSGEGFDIFLKIYSHGQSDEMKIEKEIEAMRLFQQSGLKIPTCLLGNDGKVLQKYSGFHIIATHFIPGSVFESIEFTQNRMLEVGKIVAQVENISKQIDVTTFPCLSFEEEFEYVNKNLSSEISKRQYEFDLNTYNNNLQLIKQIISRLDTSRRKQFLHRDIWPWNVIESKDGTYLLDFNDWTIGDPILELSVAILEFSMFKSGTCNIEVARNIIEGYKSVKSFPFTSEELWESILFMCYLFFAYNVIQSDEKSDSECYLKKIVTLTTNPDIFDLLI